MMTIKRKVLVAVFMLATVLNYANNADGKNVVNTKSVKVVFNEVKKGQQLTIKDVHGVVLYTENVAKEGKLIKTFDFSQLIDGSYTLELEKDFQIIVKSIKIEEGKVILNDASEKVILKPVVRNEDNLLMITKIAFDKQPLDVALYYNNEIIYSETVEGDSILNRVYKLDEALKGDYKVVIQNNGRRYSNEFKI
ncbi:hypothetical protein BW723_06545 [Polaribacter reichenbachii]|uniref:Secretion system C-terminal sorting domain-containing protein n=1 Tax=Polaribacter reichenbachii TaxID=996801 RepID=A0A1B8U627_9FLAO|nr:hypothetical protein [Polaribacter reichenbachii]APZ45972.1 hypothetical protein BW723_06545 [Polaribacter reichenbachii]AUC19834.1 hypothetical protein BTO17_14565 [Polaribacter reichenbachii]OBY67311.1 hypothetical protein LPB301_02945 [Polaribacter reichenbachii]